MRCFGIFHRRNRDDNVAFLTIDIAAMFMSTNELKNITDNFNINATISISAAKPVYRGVHGNGQVIAIKKVTSKEPMQEFLAHVSTVSKLKNDNLLHLIGYCGEEDDWKFMAYEYAPHGSLYDILHGRVRERDTGPGPLQILSWNARVKIAVGAAKGLEYLHERCNPPISHINVNSSNVLIFDDFVSKLDGIGLPSHLPDPSIWESGAALYMAPEFLMTGEPNVKCDVYSFGVVMLEILTGRKPHLGLFHWATKKCMEDEVSEWMDSKLQGNYPSEAVTKFASVAALCVKFEPAIRPSISFVVQALLPLTDEAEEVGSSNLPQIHQ